MTTLVATPMPDSSPPSILVKLDTEVAGSSIVRAELFRNGEVARPVLQLGGQIAESTDYDAQYNAPVEYRARGTYIPPSTGPDWSATWTNLLSWAAAGVGFSISGGKVSSSNVASTITRSASGVIQRLDVADPAYSTVSLLDASGAVILAVTTDAIGVTAKGEDESVLLGASGTYTLTLVDGMYSASGASGWATAGRYSGSPTRVRLQTTARLAYSTGWPAYHPNANAITTLRDGRLLAYDSAAKRATLFSADGSDAYPRTLHEQFSNITFAFGAPVGSATLADGTVVVAGGGNSAPSVVRFDDTGRYASGSFPIFSSQIVAIAANPATMTGYSIMLANGTVRMHSSFSNEYTTFAGPASPVGLAITPDGKHFSGNSTANTIQINGPTGALLGSFGVASTPTALTSDKDGNLWVYTGSTGVVRKYSPAGVQLSSFTGMAGGNSIAIDNAMNVFVASNAFGGIRKYSAAGVEVVTGRRYSLANPATDSVQLNGFNYHTDTAANVIRRVDTTLGNPVTTYATTAPRELTVDSAGNVYSYEMTAGFAGIIRRFNPSGFQTLAFVPAGLGSPNGLLGMAVPVAGGDIFMTDFDNRRVVRYNASGTGIIAFWHTVGHPSKIRVGPDGHLNVVDTENMMMRKYTLVGAEVLSFKLGDMSSTEGLDIDVAGNYYIIDNSSFSVKKYSKTGELIGSIRFSTNTTANDVLVQEDGAFQLVMTDGKVRKFSASRMSVGTVAPTLAQPQIPFDVTAETTSLPVGVAWMIHPAAPSLSRPIDYGECTGEGVFLQSQGTVTRATTAALSAPVGSKFPVGMSTGDRAGEVFDLDMLAWDEASCRGITDLLDDQSPILIRIPAGFQYGINDGWYSIGDLKVSRPVTFDMTVPMRKLTLSAIAVDQPVIVARQARTYGLAKLEADTFAGLAQARPTYLNLLLGS